MSPKNSLLIALFRLLEYTWSCLVKGLRGKTVLNQFTHHCNNTSMDLEIEAIKRFRALASSLSPQCRVFRELNGSEPILCLDFAACPQDLKKNEKEWLEFAQRLAFACHYLGLAKSMVFKRGQWIVGVMILEQMA